MTHIQTGKEGRFDSRDNYCPFAWGCAVGGSVSEEALEEVGGGGRERGQQPADGVIFGLGSIRHNERDVFGARGVDGCDLAGFRAWNNASLPFRRKRGCFRSVCCR